MRQPLDRTGLRVFWLLFAAAKSNTSKIEIPDKNIREWFLILFPMNILLFHPREL